MIDDYQNFREIRVTNNKYIATLWNNISFEISKETAEEISNSWQWYIFSKNFNYNAVGQL